VSIERYPQSGIYPQIGFGHCLMAADRRNVSNMSSNTVAEAFTALEAGLQAVGALDWDGLPIRERIEVMERLEIARRRAAACSTDIAASVARAGDPGIGTTTHKLTADVLRVSPADARRRLRDAEQLLPRATLTGQELPAELPATAKAWHAGLLDGAHLRTIQKFFRDLPDQVHPAAAEKAEAFLAEKAAELRPDQLEILADRLALKLDPDGTFSDEYRALQRGFTWCGRQRPDGMSVARLTATPELRAVIDALLAKFAAPGMCDPADQSPLTDGEPSPEAADRDRRRHGQRQHDALLALLRSQLGNSDLGRHNGLPVTVIATASVADLCAAAGYALTAGGTQIPMRDVIRMASHAWHYLCVYDEHSTRPIYLGRTKRIATADQRIVLHALDRGCTRPGCDVPGYLTEVHHIEEWAAGGATDVDKLTFACKPDHRLITVDGWRTRKLPNGRTEWIPPPQLPLPRGTNGQHHLERLLPEIAEGQGPLGGQS